MTRSNRAGANRKPRPIEPVRTHQRVYFNGHEYVWSLQQRPHRTGHTPLLDWFYVDCAGHRHQWWIKGGGPADRRFDPAAEYHLPTLRSITLDFGTAEPKWFWDLSKCGCICLFCGEVLPPDQGPQMSAYVLGAGHWASIDSQSVDPCAFRNLYVLAGGSPAGVAHLVEPDVIFDEPIPWHVWCGAKDLDV